MLSCKALRTHTPVLLLLMMLSVTSGAQDFTPFVSEKLSSYRSKFPPEKAYLHMDKPYYATGDTLWFKAYLVEGSIHSADSASTVLYVDLIHQKTGKNVGIRRVPLNGGLGHGSFTLADSIPKGAYTIRAYTNWMRNFSEEYMFHKAFYLFDNVENSSVNPSNNTEITFFPESGQLVEGLNTRIAFKAIDETGRGVQVKGFVFNQDNDTVSAFKSEHLGMGRFPFTPKPGEKYHVLVKTEGADYKNVPFPVVQESGFILIVDNISSPSKMRVVVYNKDQHVSEKSVHIVGHSRGIIAFAGKGKLTAKGLMMAIPTVDLPDGITHLTLFDDQNKPVAERLVFIDHNRSLKVKVTPSKTAYRPREKTTVEIMVTDSVGKPVEANLSVSVTDAGQIAQQPNDMSIVSYLLLSSDLKGLVEQPSYYFDPANTERKIHLDYLMMTQGWRRFRWQDVMADSIAPPKHFIEQGFTLAGEVKRGNRKIADKTMLSVFLTNDSLKTFMTAETNESGIFRLDNLAFDDSLNVRLQGMNKKNTESLTFNLFPFQAPKALPVQVPFYPVTVESELLSASLKRAEEYQEIERKIRLSREKLLQAVTIKGKREVERDSRKLYSHADASIKITPQLAGGAMSVLDILGGRVAGVRVTGSGMNASVSIRNGGEPLFVLDGMPVDKDMILNLSVFDVESIDVLKGGSAAIYGGQGGNGVISVLTKRGNANYDYSQEVVPGVFTSSLAGFDRPREFYAPKYDIKRQSDARPDYRSTVYWAPQLTTGKDGIARFEYYNTDPATTIDIRTEVLSPAGEPGFARAVYVVQ